MESTVTQPASHPVSPSSPDRLFINGRFYGSGDLAIIFSNMDTNDQNEWDPLINGMISDGYMIFTYDYREPLDDQSGALEDAMSFVSDLGARKIILIGASRGGVASLKTAALHRFDDNVSGVVAISAPIEYKGMVFYTKDELRGIKIPKLLINSENDDGADDNRKMLEIFADPKELLFYSGDAHGTELFAQHRESILTKLRAFAESAFERGKRAALI